MGEGDSGGGTEVGRVGGVLIALGANGGGIGTGLVTACLLMVKCVCVINETE